MPSQATKVLEDTLVLLASPPTHAPVGSSTDITLHQHHHLYQLSATVPSLNRLVESILVLDNIDTLPFVESFLARVYSILFGRRREGKSPSRGSFDVFTAKGLGHLTLYYRHTT